MYDVRLENRLISTDIADMMTDYVSIQLDIDNTKIKAAAMVAQEMDIKRIIGAANLNRVIGIDQYTPTPDEYEIVDGGNLTAGAPSGTLEGTFTQVSSTGSGTGLSLKVTIVDKVVTKVNSVVSLGSGYVIGDSVTLQFGVASDDNLVITINADPLDIVSAQSLREMLIAPWCYYTYARCLSMFQGTFTDSGFAVEAESVDKNAAKSVAQEMKSIGDSFMLPVVEFLELENPNTVADDQKLSPRIRVFGGQEKRGSN
jgi:hypothetical protein